MSDLTARDEAAKAIGAKLHWFPDLERARQLSDAAIDAYTQALQREGEPNEDAIALWRPDDQSPWREWESDKGDEVEGEMLDFIPLHRLDAARRRLRKFSEALARTEDELQAEQYRDQPRTWTLKAPLNAFWQAVNDAEASNESVDESLRKAFALLREQANAPEPRLSVVRVAQHRFIDDMEAALLGGSDV